jgi:hypothetical protein
MRAGGSGRKLLLQQVVLHLPEVVDAEAVGQLDLLQRVGEEAVLVAWRPRPRELVLVYPARGLGRALDLLSQDCIERKEPSLAALVVQSTSGAVGGGFKGNAQAERERCYKHWGGSRP